MTHWPYIIAAYAITLAGAGGMALASFVAMRRAEAASAAARRK